MRLPMIKESSFVPISDYGFWSICWVCDEREQEYRLMELENGSRVCKDCFEEKCCEKT